MKSWIQALLLTRQLSVSNNLFSEKSFSRISEIYDLITDQWETEMRLVGLERRR